MKLQYHAKHCQTQITLRSSASLWRARSRRYRNLFLQSIARFAASLMVYKIYIFLHRAKIKASATSRKNITKHLQIWKDYFEEES